VKHIYPVLHIYHSLKNYDHATHKTKRKPRTEEDIPPQIQYTWSSFRFFTWSRFRCSTSFIYISCVFVRFRL